jgi:U3 small nucleolar RNA-associated protein 14
MERIAAYEEANKTVSKWTPLVKKNREADHLNFDNDEARNMTRYTIR